MAADRLPAIWIEGGTANARLSIREHIYDGRVDNADAEEELSRPR